MVKSKGTAIGKGGDNEGSNQLSQEELAKTIQEVVTKEMLVFSTEEAGWILDITHDYLQMIMHTKNQAEEMRKGYESMLAPDAQLPEGITAKQIAEDLESLKQDAIHLDIAEKRTTTIRDAARDFIMSDTPEDEPVEPIKSSTESESEGPSEANVAVTE